ncbi:MAG: gas vesicle protein, partial [Microcystis panniformis]
QEVQAFLSDVKTERQKQAQEQATALRESFQKVQQESLAFLTATQKQRLDRAKQLRDDSSQFQEQRLAEAKQLKDDLRQFRQELSIYVFGK